jgi:tetratricopeptide (TPR) repeat protein
MKKKIALVLALLLLGITAAGLKLRIEALPRRKVPGAGIIYLPSGKYLKLATFGFSSLMADIVYLWAIQYYGNEEISNRYDYLLHIFGIIAELDPGYIDPYEIGALIALYDLGDVTLALKVLDLGFEKNPAQWIFPFEAGHYAAKAGGFDLAKAYYKKAMDIPGSPAIAKRLYADTAYKTMDLKTSWETWLEVFNTAQDEQIKKIASNHLYQVKATADIGVLKGAIEKYRERSGRLPAEAGELVRAGILASLPTDYDGKDYVYDPATGEFRTQVIPWKR